MKPITPTLAICLASVVAAVVAAVADLGSTDEPTSAYGGAVITIQDFAFNAAIVTPGATVSVHNADAAPHTVTGDDGDFDSDVVDPGADGTFTAPDEPGTYDYHCNIHSSMHGSLVVTDG